MSDPGLAWLGAAFGVTWLLIGAYLVRLWRAQHALDRRLSELAGRSGGTPEPAPPHD